MACCAFATASAGVAPCAMHPGNSGTSTTKAASSALQKTMSSYLWAMSVPGTQIVLEDHVPDLANLIGLRIAAILLQVQQFLHARPHEHVVTAADTFGETERSEQCAEVLEVDVR